MRLECIEKIVAGFADQKLRAISGLRLEGLNATEISERAIIPRSTVARLLDNTILPKFKTC